MKIRAFPLFILNFVLWVLNEYISNIPHTYINSQILERLQN